jgi:hypothetical protein
MSFTGAPARVVLFGDSITQKGVDVGGWTGRLAEYYIRRADVVNRGRHHFGPLWTHVPDLARLYLRANRPIRLQHAMGTAHA